MTEAQQANALAAAFPNPPSFYQHFTIDNIQRLSALRTTHAKEGAETGEEVDENVSGVLSFQLPTTLQDLPSELRFLQPPEPPSDGIWRFFGDTYDLNEGLPSLRDQGIEQLYTPPSTPPADGSETHFDRALILKRLAKSLLLNFLELMGIMSTNPEQYTEKIQDLRTLFINFHHLLNEYRPHQARESLILMMEEQLRRSKAETEGIEKMKVKVENVIRGLGQSKQAEIDNYSGDQSHKIDSHITTKALWDDLEKEFS